MKLESFSVENFRSITKARQIPLSNSTVLIGPNNEGKSNILRALNAAMFALIRYSRGLGLPSRAPNRTEADSLRAYDWSKDFPFSVVKQKPRTLNARTKITLEFLLNDSEIDEFKHLIKSKLNGTLPVCVVFSSEGYEVKIVKKGPGSKSLNSKGNRIARFLADRIQFQYIPAIRTANQSARIVENLISAELAAIEDSPQYKAAIDQIKALQKPILDAFSKDTTETLKAFLPSVRSVKFLVSDERRYTAFRQAIEINIDDGTVTSLESKGDGVQSLVALGLRRHLLEEGRKKQSYIFAIEEPEAHLHPDAIHQLRGVLQDLSRKDQLIITTHSALLANRSPLSSNVIVRRSRAAPAKNLEEIRLALGTRSPDNLINAEVVLLVEGDDDKLSIKALLGHTSEVLRIAMENGRLSIESLDGAGSLGAKIGLYKGILCKVHCFLDNDDAGRTALEKALRASLIEECDYNLTKLSGKKDSEFEDLVKPSTYSDAFLEKFGIDLEKVKPRNRKAKWSARIADVFSQSGRNFDDITKQRSKYILADAVAAAPESAIEDHANTIMETLVDALTRKLNQE